MLVKGSRLLFLLILIFTSKTIYATLTGNALLEQCKYFVENTSDTLNKYSSEELNNIENNSIACLTYINGMEDGLKTGGFIGYMTNDIVEDKINSKETLDKAGKQLSENYRYPQFFGVCPSQSFLNENLKYQRIQTIRILYNYIKEHPEKASKPVSALYLEAMQKAFSCNQN